MWILVFVLFSFAYCDKISQIWKTPGHQVEYENYKNLWDLKPVQRRQTIDPTGQKIDHERINYVTKEVKVPYPVRVEKRVPFVIHVPKERHIPVEIQKPYPVQIEKKIPVPVKVYVPQPYPVEKKIPYPVKIHIDVPRPYHVDKPVPVYITKEIPVPVYKEVPYTVKVPYDVPKPFEVKVPVERKVPFYVEKPVPVEVPVEYEKPYPVYIPRPFSVPIEKHYPVTVEKKVPHEVKVPEYVKNHVAVYNKQKHSSLGQESKTNHIYTEPTKYSQHHKINLKPEQERESWPKKTRNKENSQAGRPRNRPHALPLRQTYVSKYKGIDEDKTNIHKMKKNKEVNRGKHRVIHHYERPVSNKRPYIKEEHEEYEEYEDEENDDIEDYEDDYYHKVPKMKKNKNNKIKKPSKHKMVINVSERVESVNKRPHIKAVKNEEYEAMKDVNHDVEDYEEDDDENIKDKRTDRQIVFDDSYFPVY